MEICQRTENTLGTCPACGATADEECPYVGLMPGLLESAPISAGSAGVCDPDDGVCESCQ